MPRRRRRRRRRSPGTIRVAKNVCVIEGNLQTRPLVMVRWKGNENTWIGSGLPTAVFHTRL